MKRYMKKKIIQIIGLVLMVILTGITGCNRIHDVYEEGYYKYIVVGKENRFPLNKEDEYIAIVGLTALGQEQQVLEIPRSIDGKEVICLGYDVGGTMTGTKYYHLESSNLEKIYIHGNISKIEEEAFYTFRKRNLNLLYCGTNPISLIDKVKIFVYKEIYNEADKYFYTIPDGRKIFYWEKTDLIPANVVFMSNFPEDENRGYYRLDNVKNGEKIMEPPNPKREGYHFTGWYTEAGLEHLWNFDKEIEIKEGFEFRLYAGWQLK